jgi:phenylpropionate dioxygenase-like ring-hydroxylating dioxygenase large terminal subunit
MNKPVDIAKEELSVPMTYGVKSYISPEFVELERNKMWRKVWLEAGRVEEIPNVGDFMSYEILDDSVLIVRSGENEIKAYHNVCVHRGRRLVDIPAGARSAEGRTSQFVCGYHGWQYNLQGENTRIDC